MKILTLPSANASWEGDTNALQHEATDKNRLIHSPFVKTCALCRQALENEAKGSRC